MASKRICLAFVAALIPPLLSADEIGEALSREGLTVNEDMLEPLPLSMLQNAIQQGIDLASEQDGLDAPIPQENERAMLPGMKITVTNVDGTLVIEAGQGLQRKFTWEGATRSVEMWARKKEWYGHRDLYFPGPGNHWREHHGITRANVGEGELHFDSREELIAWLKQNRKKKEFFGQMMYHSSGLAIRWSKNLSRAALDVDMWQLYVKDKKATDLPDSNDDKFIVEVPAK